MRKRALLLTLSFVIIVLVFIVVWNSEKGNGAPLEKNDQWIKNTLQIINDSQNADGGYALLNSERPISLYDTRYNIEIFHKFSYEVSNKEELGKTLRLMERQPVNVNGSIEILNVSYLTHLLKELNISPIQEFQNSVTKSISSLEGSDGLFRLQKDDNLINAIVITEMSVKILNDMGVKHDYQTLSHTISELYGGKNYNGNNLWNSPKSYFWTVLRSVNTIEKLISSNNYYETDQGKLLVSKMKQESDTRFSSKPSDVTNLINDFALFQLLTDLGFKPNVNTEYEKFLNSIRAPNGGTGLELNISDPQLSLQSFELDPNNTDNAQRYLTAIKKYQLTNGMFSSNNAVNSSVMSSYRALSELRSLNAPIPDSLQKYFINLKTKDLTSKEFYYWLKAITSLGLKVPEEIKASYNNIKIEKISNENDLYAMLDKLLLNDKIEEENIQILRQLENADGGYGMGGISDLQQTGLIVKELQRAGASYPIESIKQWLSSKQLRDGSFSLKGAPDMIDTYYALSIYDTIGDSPNNLKGLSSFLKNHKIIEGGYVFFKGSSSIVTLESTYFGIESEVLLEKFVNS